MKARTLFLIAVTALLLLGIAGAAQSGGRGPVAGYVVQPGTASGGAYRLTGLAWQVNGTADGGGYLLQAVGRTMARGSGCCCAYLPCILRNLH
jgi:hypothetical protein